MPQNRGYKEYGLSGVNGSRSLFGGVNGVVHVCSVTGILGNESPCQGGSPHVTLLLETLTNWFMVDQ